MKMDEENILQRIGVYTITSPSGKKYVGMTAAQSFEERWTQHRKMLRNGRHVCTGLQNAFNKYGAENLFFEIILSFKKPYEQNRVLTTLIQEEETRFWDLFKNKGVKLYNGRPTGTGSVHHTLETRAKISAGLEKYFTARGIMLHKRGETGTKQQRIDFVKKCQYCLMRFTSYNVLKLYCSKRCSITFIKNNNQSIQFTIYPTRKILNKEYAKTQNIKELSKHFGMNKNDLRFFLVQYEIIKTEKKFKESTYPSISSFDKTRECLLCGDIFEIKNRSIAEYCSDKCRKEVSKPKRDYTQKPTKELLEKLYVDEGFSTTQIAEKLNCTQPNVHYLLKKFEIPRRDKNKNNRRD